MDSSITALLSGPDNPGIVAGVAGWIHERGEACFMPISILIVRKTFFSRESNGNRRKRRRSLKNRVLLSGWQRNELGMHARMALSHDCPKVAVMVSKADHCFHDLVLRVRAGEWKASFAGVLSNHEDLRPVSENYGMPFRSHSLTEQSKPQVESEQLAWIKDQGVELVILARYMQILSKDFLDRVGCPVINIHHSFLPSFAGAKPYHQAYRRGVKLSGRQPIRYRGSGRRANHRARRYTGQPSPWPHGPCGERSRPGKTRFVHSRSETSAKPCSRLPQQDGCL